MKKQNLVFTKVGSIYYVDLGLETDHCIAKTRPCVVVDYDRATVTVIPITDNVDSSPHHSEIPIPQGIGNLKKNSKLKMGQIQTVDRCKVCSYLGNLTAEYLEQIQNYIQKKGILRKIDKLISSRKAVYNSRFNSTINSIG